MHIVGLRQLQVPGFKECKKVNIYFLAPVKLTASLRSGGPEGLRLKGCRPFITRHVTECERERGSERQAAVERPQRGRKLTVKK